uniref:aminotransferase class V-fold PLP-dependent enzyme n=1 Tax=Staphylococcus capitis TaxID=29388 RepID=UPI0021B1A050
MNIVGRSYGEGKVEEGDEIVVSEMEHDANIVRWEELAKRKNACVKFMGMSDEGEVRVDEIKERINEKSKIVGIGDVCKVLGRINDVKRIGEMGDEDG